MPLQSYRSCIQYCAIVILIPILEPDCIIVLEIVVLLLKCTERAVIEPYSGETRQRQPLVHWIRGRGGPDSKNAGTLKEKVFGSHSVSGCSGSRVGPATHFRLTFAELRKV